MGPGGRRGDLLAAQRRRRQRPAAGRGRADPAGHPAADRPGRHPRPAHDGSDAAGHGSQLRSRHGRAHRPARRSGSGFGRSELDVLPHDRCQPGSSLGPGGRGFRGRPVPDGRDGRGDDPRLPGRRSPRAGQHRGDGEALRRLRPRRGRPGLQHGRHVRIPSPERLPGTLPRRHCRRSRIGDGRVQYDRRQADARAPAPADRCPQGRVGYARRHRRRRGRRRQPGPARCRHGPARRGAAVGAGGSRHRDGRQPDR